MPDQPAKNRTYPAEEVGAIISNVLRSSPASAPHPAEAVSDQLAAIVEQHRDWFTGSYLDMVAVIRHRLEDIAEGTTGQAGAPATPAGPLGADPGLWIAVLSAFRRSRARGMRWGRGDVARALHVLDRAAGPDGGAR